MNFSFFYLTIVVIFAQTIKTRIMCLSIPAKIISIKGDMAKVSVGGAEYEASIQMVPEAKTGDYIIMHTGFAIQIIDEEEAAETLKTFQEFKDLNQMLDQEENETGKRIT